MKDGKNDHFHDKIYIKPTHCSRTRTKHSVTSRNSYEVQPLQKSKNFQIEIPQIFENFLIGSSKERIKSSQSIKKYQESENNRKRSVQIVKNSNNIETSSNEKILTIDIKKVPSCVKIDLLPLAFFDDESFETIDFESIREKLKSNEIITAQTILYKDCQLIWKPALVLDISDDNQTFLVEYLENQIRKFVSRLNLMFPFEKESDFLARRNFAIESRSSFVRMERYYIYLTYKLKVTDSFLKADDLLQLCHKIHPKYLKNQTFVAQLLSEISLLDVRNQFQCDYFHDLENHQFVEEMKKINFPLRNDFELSHIKYYADLPISSHVKLIVENLQSNSIIFEPIKGKNLLKLLQRIQEFSQSKLFIFPNTKEIIPTCLSIIDQIQENVLVKMDSTIRQFVESACKLSFLNRALFYLVDLSINIAITKILVNSTTNLIEWIQSDKFIFNIFINKVSDIDLTEEKKVLMKIPEILNRASENKSIRTTVGIVFSEPLYLQPIQSWIRPYLEKLNFIIKEEIFENFDKMKLYLTKIINLYSVPNKFSHVFLNEIQNIRQNELEENSIFLTQILQNQNSLKEKSQETYGFKRHMFFSFDNISYDDNYFFFKCINIDSEIMITRIKLMQNVIKNNDSFPTKLLFSTKEFQINQKIVLYYQHKLTEILSLSGTQKFPKLYINFKSLLCYFRKKISNLIQSLIFSLFLHGASVVFSLIDKLDHCKFLLTKSPQEIDTYQELLNYLERVPHLLSLFEEPIDEIKNIINSLSVIFSPFSHLLSSFLFKFRYNLLLFKRSFYIKMSILDEAKLRIRKDHDQKEIGLKHVFMTIQEDLNQFSQAKLTKDIEHSLEKIKDINQRFNCLLPIINELNEAATILKRTPFDTIQFNNSYKFSINLEKLYQMIFDFNMINEDIAVKTLDVINITNLKEHLSQWKNILTQLSDPEIGIHPEVYSIIRTMKTHIFNFEQYSNIIELLLKPYLRRRHWEEINNLFHFDDGRLDLTVTLYFLVEINILSKNEEIQQITDIAFHEYEIETQLTALISQVSQSITPEQLKLKNIKSFTDKNTKLFESQLAFIKEINSSQYSSKFSEEINNHMGYIHKLQSFNKILSNCNNLYHDLKYFIKAPDTSTNNKTIVQKFSYIKKEFVVHLLHIKNFSIAFSEIQEFDQIFQQLEIIAKEIDSYINIRRNSFSRFAFLSNRELFKLISSSFKASPQVINSTFNSFCSNMKLIFPYIYKLIVIPETSDDANHNDIKHYSCSGIVSFHKEIVQIIPFPFDLSDLVVFLENLQTHLKESLFEQTTSLLSRNFSYFTNHINEFSFLSIFVYLMVHFTKMLKNPLSLRSQQQVQNVINEFRRFTSIIPLKLNNPTTMHSINSIITYILSTLKELAKLNNWSVIDQVKQSAISSTSELRFSSHLRRIDSQSSQTGILLQNPLTFSKPIKNPKKSHKNLSEITFVFETPQTKIEAMKIQKAVITAKNSLSVIEPIDKIGNRLINDTSKGDDNCKARKREISISGRHTPIVTNSKKMIASSSSMKGDLSIFQPITSALTQNQKRKDPLFYKFKYNAHNNEILVAIDGFSFPFCFEYFGNDFDITSLQNHKNLIQLLESLNNRKRTAFCYPFMNENDLEAQNDENVVFSYQSIRVDNFLRNVSKLFATSLISIQISSPYYIENYHYMNFFTTSVQNEKIWIHLENFDVLEPADQNRILYSTQNIKSLLFISGDSISNSLFSFFTPLILNLSTFNNEYTQALQTTQGFDDNFKEKALSSSDSTLYVYDSIDMLSNFDFSSKSRDIQKIIILIKERPEVFHMSLCELSPYLINSFGDKIFIPENIEIIFDDPFHFSVAQIEKLFFVNDKPDKEKELTQKMEFKKLVSIFGEELSYFFIMQASSLSKDPIIIQQIINNLISLLFPSVLFDNEDQEINQSFHPIKVLKNLVSLHKNVLVIGNRSLSMILSIHRLLNSKVQSKDSGTERDTNSITIIDNFSFSNLKKNEKQMNSSGLLNIFSKRPKFENTTVAILSQQEITSFKFDDINYYHFQLMPFIEPPKEYQSTTFVKTFKDFLFHLHDSLPLFSLITSASNFLSTHSDIIKQWIPIQYNSNFSESIFQSGGFFYTQSPSDISLIWNLNMFALPLNNIHFILLVDIDYDDFIFAYSNIVDLFQLIYEEPSHISEHSLPGKFEEIMDYLASKYDIDDTYRERILTDYSILLEQNLNILQKDIKQSEDYLHSFDVLEELYEKSEKTLLQSSEEFDHISSERQIIISRIEEAKNNLETLKTKSEEQYHTINPNLDVEIECCKNIQNKLDSLLPILKKTLNFISSLDSSVVQFIRSITSPSPSLLPIYECLSTIFDVKPNLKKSGGIKIIDYFEPMQKTITDPHFQILLTNCAEQRFSDQKIKKLQTLLENSKKVWGRAVKSNHELAKIAKWMHQIVKAHNLHKDIDPLLAEQKTHTFQKEQYQKILSDNENEIRFRTAKIEEMSDFLIVINERRNNAQVRVNKAEELIQKIIRFREVIIQEFDKTQKHLEKLRLKADYLPAFSFIQSLTSNYFSSIPYEEHKLAKNEVLRVLNTNKYFPINEELNMEKHHLKLRFLGILNDDILIDKVDALLSPLHTSSPKIVFDPCGLVLYFLQDLYHHIQIILEPQDNYTISSDIIICFLNDYPDIFKYSKLINQYSNLQKIFIINHLDENNNIPKTIQKYFIFIDFSESFLLPIFYERFMLGLFPQILINLVEIEQAYKESKQKKAEIMKKISIALSTNPNDFFLSDSWKNCYSFYEEQNKNEKLLSSQLISKQKEIEEIQNPILEKSLFANNLYIHISALSEEYLIFPSFIKIIETIGENDEIMKIFSSTFRLMIQKYIAAVSDDYTFLFNTIDPEKFYTNTPSLLSNVEFKHKLFESAFIKKWTKEDQKFPTGELTIDATIPFDWISCLQNFRNQLPIFVISKVYNDPTNMILSPNFNQQDGTVSPIKKGDFHCYANGDVLPLDEEIPDKYFRYNGIIIIRYPDLQDNGFSLLSKYIEKLFTLRQFPSDFRLVIIVQESSVIPQNISCMSVKMWWPVLQPPSSTLMYYTSYITNKFGVKMKDLSVDQYKVITTLSNMSFLMGCFIPNSALDDFVHDLLTSSIHHSLEKENLKMKHKNFTIYDMKTAKNIPIFYRRNYNELLDDLWMERINKCIDENIPLFSFSKFPEIQSKYIFLSKEKIDDGIEVTGISILDGEWSTDNHEFVKKNFFYPIPLGPAWVIATPLDQIDDTNENEYCSKLFIGDPSSSAMYKVAAPGIGVFHFLFE